MIQAQPERRVERSPGAWGGVVGSLLAMVSKLLHPATPTRDPGASPARSPTAGDRRGAGPTRALRTGAVRLKLNKPMPL
jgi:hypothetical protein